VAGGCESRRELTEGCLFKKISILISAYGSTAEGGLFLVRIDGQDREKRSGTDHANRPRFSFSRYRSPESAQSVARVRPVEAEAGARERRWASDFRSWRQGSSKATCAVLVAVSCTAMGFTGRPLRRTS